METYYQLEPEVSGELGENSIIQKNPLRVIKLEFEFKSWLGDCLIECFPIFLITENALKKIKENNATGFSIKEATIKKEYPMNELQPNIKIPKFEWININGIAKKNDFGIENNFLIVSKNVLEILRSENLNYCEIIQIKN